MTILMLIKWKKNKLIENQGRNSSKFGISMSQTSKLGLESSSFSTYINEIALGLPNSPSFIN